MICLYLKIPKNFVRLILQDGFWFVHYQMRIVTWRHNCLHMIIITYLKPYNCFKKDWLQHWITHQGLTSRKTKESTMTNMLIIIIMLRWDYKLWLHHRQTLLALAPIQDSEAIYRHSFSSNEKSSLICVLCLMAYQPFAGYSMPKLSL